MRAPPVRPADSFRVRRPSSIIPSSRSVSSGACSVAITTPCTRRSTSTGLMSSRSAGLWARSAAARPRRAWRPSNGDELGVLAERVDERAGQAALGGQVRGHRPHPPGERRSGDRCRSCTRPPSSRPRPPGCGTPPPAGRSGSGSAGRGCRSRPRRAWRCPQGARRRRLGECRGRGFKELRAAAPRVGAHPRLFARFGAGLITHVHRFTHTTRFAKRRLPPYSNRSEPPYLS